LSIAADLNRLRRVARRLNIVGISMIRNDADIVEPFVRHCCRLLDHLFIVVHSPEDGTDEILKALHAEGLPITLVIDDEPAFLQGERLTWLAREAHAGLKPDFIFPLDADEFLLPADREAIEASLETVPPHAPAGRVRLRTFLPTADDPADEPNPLRRIRYRVRDEGKVTKVVLSRAFAADPTLVLDHGNHGLLRIGAAATHVPVPGLRALALAHYPVRSAAQVINKTIVGYLAHIASERPSVEEERLATHWRRCYEDLVVRGATRGMSEQQVMGWFHGRRDVEQDAETFVCDPTPTDDALRYTHLVRNDSYATLARFAEHLIRKRTGYLDGMRFEHAPAAPTATGSGGRGRS
jgi:glycosyl transferase family 2